MTTNQTAYKNMPLSEVLDRQRSRLFAKMTHYAEVGEYSALVYKDVGMRGPFWHIGIRKGQQVLTTDIHYAGPDHAQRRAAEMLAAVCGVEVKDSEVCDGVNVIATASYKTGHTYSDGKAQRAIAYTINGEAVMSLPARLNNGRIPDLDECADILDGVSVRESDGWRNRAHDLHELARRIVLEVLAEQPGGSAGASMTVTGDGTPEGVKYIMWHGRRSHTLHAVATSPARLRAHWSGFLDNCREADYIAARGKVEAPRVDLSKPAAPLHVASVLELPQEPNASVLERVAASLRARRLSSVPAVVVEEVEQIELPPPPAVVYVPLDVLHDAPGDPCPGCGACLHAGQDMCDDCRQHAPAVRNLYMCPLCKHEWSGDWTSKAHDDCPNCNAHDVEPYDVEEVAA